MNSSQIPLPPKGSKPKTCSFLSLKGKLQSILD